jgi:hypothetical protein
MTERLRGTAAWHGHLKKFLHQLSTKNLIAKRLKTSLRIIQNAY